MCIRDSFHGILANINQITHNLRDADIDEDLVNQTLLAIEQAALDVSTAALSVDETSDELNALVKDDVKSVLARAKVTMDQLDKTLLSFEGVADGTDYLIADSRDAINRLSNSGLRDLEETADGMRRVILTLGRILDSLENNPTQFIAGSERETVEIPQ